MSFGPWDDLRGTLRTIKEWGVPYVTVLFIKRENHFAPTPPGFLNYLFRQWPDLFDPTWQVDKLREIQEVYGPECVLMEQTGFSSLTTPHHVAMR